MKLGGLLLLFVMLALLGENGLGFACYEYVIVLFSYSRIYLYVDGVLLLLLLCCTFESVCVSQVLA